MPARSSNPAADVTARRLKVRSLVSGIFVQAIGKASQAGAARSLGVTEKTVRRWLKRQTPMDLELVLSTPRIGRRFRELLCIHSHDEFPYVARKSSKRAA